MIYSRTFKPAPAMCCQACVFGQGEHEPWCEKSTPCPNCGDRFDTPPGCSGRSVRCGCGRWFPLNEGFMILDSEKYRAYLRTLPTDHPHREGKVVGYDSKDDYIAGIPSKPKRRRAGKE